MPAPAVAAKLNALTLAGNIPVSVTIELTRRCPLACAHCYLPETRGRAARGKELSAAAWGKILRRLADAGGLYLVFTGGEPLLRPDLPELCRRAKALNFDVRVFSTGLGLTKNKAAALKKAGISSFEISLYGRPGTHDRVTALKGSFRRSLAAARLLKRSGVRVKIKSPLMTLNTGQAGWLKKFAAGEGFGIAFDPVVAPANDGDKAALAYRLSGRLLAAAVERLSVPPGGPGLAEAQGPVLPAPDFLCGAGRNVCAVGPDGELYPCLQLPVPLGNLSRAPFSALWKNSRWLKKWRSAGLKDLKVCAACPDLDFCSRCPGISLLEAGDIFAPNAAACALAGIQGKLARKRG